MNCAQLYSLGLLLLVSLSGKAQKANSSSLGLELGAVGYFNSVKENRDIRKLSESDFSGLLITGSIALKYEKVFFDDRLGVASGVRFTSANSSFGVKGFFHSGIDYFYMRANEEGTTTDYLTVQQITQQSSYIGIPLEVRYLLFRLSSTRLYFKAGSSFDFLIKSKNKLELAFSHTSSLETVGANRVGTPADFNASLYGGIGLRIGESFPINIEFTIPSFALSPNYSSVLKPTWGTGVKFMVQIPLKKKE